MSAQLYGAESSQETRRLVFLFTKASGEFVICTVKNDGYLHFNKVLAENYQTHLLNWQERD